MKLCLLISFLFIILQLSYIDARRKSSSSGSLLRRGSSSSSKGNSRPSSGGSHGSAPPSPGWNVPKQQPSVQKPSAPVNEHISKTSSSNVQSSNWKPSGGYNTQTGTPYGNVGSNQHSPSQGYNPSVGSYQHNTHAGAPYNPSHAPGNTGYNSYGSPPGYHAPSYHAPSYHAPAGHSPGYGAPPAYNPYNPSYGHSYTPGAGYNPPVGHAPQTILVQGSSRPGIGQLAKEALVFAGVSAGVNAVANRIIPGGIYGGHGSYGGSSSSGAAANVPAVTHTQITYNNYYNNGTAPASGAPASEVAPAAGAPAAPLPPSIAASAPAPAPAGPEPSPVVPIEAASNANPPTNQPTPAPSSAPANEDANFPSPTGQIVTKTDIHKLTEDLFTKDTNNAFKHITMNLQGQKMDDSTKDDAPESLLTVKDEAYQIPTVKAVIALHDNYELDVKVKETVTPEERKEESDLLDLMLETDIMKTTMKFLADKGYIPNDEYELKDTLKRVWFSQFKRIDGEPGSSGFETVFLAEKFDNEIIGLHNWIYYARQEAEKKLNYLGYIKQTSLGDKGAIVKLRSSLNDIIQPVTTIFVGTSPELEMALYTICFYTRPNYQCPIKLGNNEFMIIANRVNYFGKDILVSAYPEI